MPFSKRINFNHFRLVLFIALLLPLGWIIAGFFNQRLGANPVETISHETGRWALRCLLLSLSITPLVKLTGVKKLMLLRRMIGLYAFFYATLHMLIYAWFDQSWSLALIAEDILERPYITLGFSAWLLMIPLALTSPMAMRRKMGRRWIRLHKLVYLIAALALCHYLWKIRADFSEIYPYLCWAGIVLITRLYAAAGLTFNSKKKPA